MHSTLNHKYLKGFTIVELLVVVVVIGILSTIIVLAFNGTQDSSRLSKVKSDLAQISKAVQAARTNTGKTMREITGSNCTACYCYSKTTGTDLAVLVQTSDTCWTVYAASLANLSNASGINVNNLLDPWGRPYAFDENEGEGGGCSADSTWTYTNPFVYQGGSWKGYVITIPKSGNSGCVV